MPGGEVPWSGGFEGRGLWELGGQSAWGPWGALMGDAWRALTGDALPSALLEPGRERLPFAAGSAPWLLEGEWLACCLEGESLIGSLEGERPWAWVAREGPHWEPEMWERVGLR